MTIVTTQGMDYNSGIRSLVAEASTLGFPVGGFPQELTVRSHLTGREIEFKLNENKYDPEEGELLSVIYTSGAGYNLVVWND